jgi:hypothetical protein
MHKYKVFISSAQSEFSKKRQHVKELLAPEIDLSAELITSIWHDNVATDLLAENKRIIDRIVKPRMTKEQLRECVIGVS